MLCDCDDINELDQGIGIKQIKMIRKLAFLDLLTFNMK